MARKKLSEFRAKTILYAALGQSYDGKTLDAKADWREVIAGLDEGLTYVVKVDQAEKGRYKKGLVKLNRPKGLVGNDAEEFFSQGYRYLLVEPHQEHDGSDERYLSIERTRDGNRISFSSSGGVDVEDQTQSMSVFLYGATDSSVGVPESSLDNLVRAFDENHIGFLEINPLLVYGDQVALLDAAVEVDGEGEFFEDNWTAADLRQPRGRALSPEEVSVQELAAKSQASFSLEVINPEGSIFLLLSGGGASVVVADEVFNLGFGNQLANYGEYSGNPNFEETRIYTEQILSLLLKSPATGKVLIIGGGVANFTDVRATFKGVVAALKVYEEDLKKQAVKVYVRRGGPHEKEGLAAMASYLKGCGLLGHVAGPDLLLSDIVGLAVGEEGK